MDKIWSGKLHVLFHGPRHWELIKDLWFSSSCPIPYLDEWKRLGVNIVPIVTNYQDPVRSTKCRITVSKGYDTDLASIHRVAWSFIAPWDIARASVIHDVLMEAIRSDLDNLSKKQIRELRKNADNVLLDGMNNAEPDVPAWKIKACYSIVRLLGGVCIRNKSYRERHGW